MSGRSQHWKSILGARWQNVRAWSGSRALSVRVVLLGAAVVVILPLLATNALVLQRYAANERTRAEQELVESAKGAANLGRVPK